MTLCLLFAMGVMEEICQYLDMHSHSLHGAADFKNIIISQKFLIVLQMGLDCFIDV